MIQQTLNVYLTVLILGFASAAVAQDKKEEPKKDAKQEEKAKPKPLFPDKNLEAAVREQVFEKRDTNEPIYEEDVKDISVVKGKGMGIKDLTGLEKCTALMSVELAENQITDVSPLKTLKRVQLLDLADNKIQDITSLGEMEALQYINIENNQVKSIAPLKNLEKLRSFYADGNQIQDLSPLYGIPKLHTVQVNDNQIKSIDGINQLKWLDSLGLAGNQISDLSPLKGLNNLMYHLFLQNNQIKDLGPLLEMCKKDLEGDKRFAPFLRIYLKGNPLDNPQAQKQLKEMKDLGLRIQDL